MKMTMSMSMSMSMTMTMTMSTNTINCSTDVAFVVAFVVTDDCVFDVVSVAAFV